MGQWRSRVAGAVQRSWPSQFSGRSRASTRLRAILTGCRVDAFLASDIGCVRDSNQDSMALVVPGEAALRQRRGLLAVVADGMGGHNGGEVASAVAVETICRSYFSAAAAEDPAAALALALREANAAVFGTAEADSRLAGMGTTATALALVDGHALVAHVGDSRVYHCRSGQGRQLTTDDSLIVELINNGMISAEQARHHPARNVLLRSLGTQAKLWVIANPGAPAAPGDSFVLCSDGLWDSIDADEIAQFVAAMNPEEAVRRLIALARARDGSDNISVGVLTIQAAPAVPA